LLGRRQIGIRLTLVCATFRQPVAVGVSTMTGQPPLPHQVLKSAQ
jgi:hypothetical protein